MLNIKESMKTIVKANTFALFLMHISNRYISSIALTNNMLKSGGVCRHYRWQHGDVYYHKHGSGTPIVMLHHLDPAFSSYEWNEIIDDLSANHTVYAVDLPGCGRSVKENADYSNYYYVLFLSSFIKEVVKTKCTIIASGYSSSFAIMTAAMNPALIKKIIAVNPKSLRELMLTEDDKSKAAGILLSLPIIGTTVYNMSQSKGNIDLDFTEKYLYNPFRSQKRFVSAFYEGAHFNESNGKYLLAALKARRMTVNTEKALKKAGEKIVILYGDHAENADQIINGYTSLNPSITAYSIKGTKMLPHMERPELFLKDCLYHIDM